MPRKIIISFDTKPWVRSHCQEPRGRGSWAFSIDGGEALFSPSMTYSEAKAWVRAKALAMVPAGFVGIVDIEVLP
jgi:hypothetical protein